jgi:hydrazine synthase alpha subunit-like protein
MGKWMSRARKAVLFCLLVLSAATLASWTTRPPKPVYLSVHFEGDDPAADPHRPARARLIAAHSQSSVVSRQSSAGPATHDSRLTTAERSGEQDLAPGFAAVSDPEISFDGLTVLFAGRRNAGAGAGGAAGALWGAGPRAQGRGPGPGWQIWEVRRDGRSLRQITHEDADCTEPHYLPDGRILFCRVFGQTVALCAQKPEERGRSEATGAGPRGATRLTFNLDPIRDTTVLPDGRVLCHLGGRWVTVNSDGTGVAAFTGTPAEIQAARAQAQTALSPTGPRAVPTGHVTVVDPKKKTTGLLFCLNAYVSDLPKVRALPDGTFRKVRVWQAGGYPAAQGGRSRVSEPRVLGEAPVEPDGSFLLELPADTPIRLEMLGASGEVIGVCRAWTWLRPNENRGCIGCHEPPELSPENRVQMALRRPATRLGVGLQAKR